MQNKNSDVKTIAVIALKLLVICSLVAVLVATVNHFTKDRIVLNQKIKTADALTQICKNEGLFFSVDDNGGFAVKDGEGSPAGVCRAFDGELLEDVDSLYIIESLDGDVISYCVEASPMGFKDEVSMLVAINPDMTVKEVQIISLSDTKGIGDKVTNASHLSGFVGRKNGFNVSDMVIAGATRTSEPVAKAVNTALAQVEASAENGGDSNE